MLTRTFRDLSIGVQFSEVKAGLGVTPRSWRRWTATGEAPAHVIAWLTQHRYGVPVSAPAWDGFQFRAGALWTPENMSVMPADVRALPYLSALNRELTRKLREPQQWPLC